MKKHVFLSFIFMMLVLLVAGCSTSYKATPLPFKAPSAYGNLAVVAQAQVGAKAYADPEEAKSAFGFDIRGAGMLPVQVVFDNLGPHFLEIDGTQTFLEDETGNLWPILSTKIAYDRATKYAQTKKIFKEGAYSGFLGAAAGSIIGAAVGIASGDNIGELMGKGAAVGAAAGATIGGTQGYASSNAARREIVTDLKEKSLQNKAISPKSMAHGIIFFPGEAKSAKNLRLKITETDTGKIHVITFDVSGKLPK
ncbi:MAG: hypothetical protein B6I22_07625 [Desulfobacteraceae bacterium 4572_123]|nr:MAG: hypothetical protein B6I22_07625 [Desulfobacteraceae bacterium 4572_123]